MLVDKIFFHALVPNKPKPICVECEAIFISVDVNDFDLHTHRGPLIRNAVPIPSMRIVSRQTPIKLDKLPGEKGKDSRLEKETSLHPNNNRRRRTTVTRISVVV